MKAGKGSANDYVIRLVDDPTHIDAAQWNDLLAKQARPTPFMRHEYLVALHRSGSAVPDAGWAPLFVTIERGGALVAACALYLKSHSYGEYVFDWAWADAYRRHGLAYYPKLLAAVPFTPVPGSRLLARDAATRDRLVHAIETFMDTHRLSSAHLLFGDDNDFDALSRAGWLLREGVQFHWSSSGERDFDDLLSRLRRDKRKKIAQERRRVLDAGVRYNVRQGAQIDAAQWDFFHRCYSLTYAAHHSTPYLTRAFFDEVARTMPAHWAMFVAERAGEPIAASLIALDPAHRVAYGRYWGATTFVGGLHFDACYYQPLAWCIAHGYQRFEGGAQGEHKMARGLLPVRTRSAHRLADARFASAVADFLRSEGAGIDAYVDELNERNPFKSVPPGA